MLCFECVFGAFFKPLQRINNEAISRLNKEQYGVPHYRHATWPAVPANFFGILRCMPDKSLQPSITFFIHFSSKSHLGSHKHSMGKSIKRGRQKKQVNASLEYPAL